MKFLLIFGGFALLLSSCVTQMNFHAPTFTSADKMIQLKKGMDVVKVNETLGILPYDMYVLQEEGVAVAVYYYRTKQRKMKLSTDLKKQETQKFGSEDGQTAGQGWYDKDEKKLYVLFENGAMKSFITDKGRADGEQLLIVDNNLKYITEKEFNTVEHGGVVLVSDRADKSDKKGRQSKAVNASSNKIKARRAYTKEEYQQLSAADKQKVKTKTASTVVGVLVLFLLGIVLIGSVASEGG